MVSGKAVGAMDGRVHDAFKPSVLRYKRKGFKAPGRTQRSPPWLEFTNTILCVGELVRNWPLHANVVFQLLSRAGPSLTASVTKYPDKCFRQFTLWMFAEEEQARDREFSILH